MPEAVFGDAKAAMGLGEVVVADLNKLVRFALSEVSQKIDLLYLANYVFWYV